MRSQSYFTRWFVAFVTVVLASSAVTAIYTLVADRPSAQAVALTQPQATYNLFHPVFHKNYFDTSTLFMQNTSGAQTPVTLTFSQGVFSPRSAD